MLPGYLISALHTLYDQCPNPRICTATAYRHDYPSNPIKFQVVADAKSEQVGYDNPTMEDDEVDSTGGSRSGYNSDTEADAFDDVVFDNFDSNLGGHEAGDEDSDDEEEGLSHLRTLGRAYERDFDAAKRSEGKLFGMRSLPNLSEIPEDDGFLEHLEMQDQQPRDREPRSGINHDDDSTEGVGSQGKVDAVTQM